MPTFYRSNFYDIKKITLSEFINFHKTKIISSSILENFIIKDISSNNIFHDSSILFIKKNNIHNINHLKKKNIVIITDVSEYYDLVKNSNSVILVSSIDNIYKYFLDSIFTSDDNNSFKDNYELINGSYISLDAKIDKSSKVYPGCTIGRGCQIGKNTIIKQNCSIKYTIVGNDTIVNENSSIGSTGFGFPTNKGSNLLFPHLGYVYIGNNCSIGSNCTIDRGKLDVTSIDDYCMLDNLIHVAHNVSIKKNSTISAQTGISGSVVIDEGVTIGGQVGFAGHIKVGRDSVIAAKSGVTKSIKPKSIVAGFPAIDIKKWKKIVIKLKAWI